ncbi:MAG: hypothetical protein ACE5D4_05985 [Thermodesulfobacteriota bacterium]
MYSFFSRAKEKQGPVYVTLALGPVPGTDEGPAKLIISAINRDSDESIVLDGPGIRLPNKKSVILPMPLGRVRFPCVLHKGDEDCCVWTDARTLAENLSARNYTGDCQIVGYFNSGLGKRASVYVSPPLGFNIEEQLEG